MTDYDRKIQEYDPARVKELRGIIAACCDELNLPNCHPDDEQSFRHELEIAEAQLAEHMRIRDRVAVVSHWDWDYELFIINGVRVWRHAIEGHRVVDQLMIVDLELGLGSQNEDL